MARSIRFALITSVSLGLAGLAPAASAAIFCVDTAAQFQAALNTAQANGQDDAIRLRTGHYVHTHALAFYGTEAQALEISGGWVSVGQEPCGTQVQDARATLLDGAADHQILRLESHGIGGPGRLARYSVSNLQFDDAFGQGYIAGGAMHMKAMSDMRVDFNVDNVIFSNNRAYNGGALFLFVQDGQARVANSLFHDNTVTTANGGHLAITTGASAEVFVMNSTFARASCVGSPIQGCALHADLGNLSHVHVRDSLFWQNPGSDIHTYRSQYVTQDPSLSLDHVLASVTGSVTATITTPLTGDPLFVNAAAADFRLHDSSPLINRSSAAPPMAGGVLPFDIYGNPRIAFARADPGALENQTADSLFANGFDSVP